MRFSLIICCMLIAVCATSQHRSKLDSLLKTRTPAARPAQTQWSSCLMDSAHRYTLQNSALMMNYRAVYSYDNNRNMTMAIYYIMQNNTVVMTQRILNTFNPQNLQTVRTVQTWNMGAWLNQQNETYIFDAGNRQTSVITATWSGSAWANATRDSTTYNSNNNVTQHMFETWNAQTSAWSNATRETYTFDPTFHLTNESVESFNTSTNTWSVSGSYDYTLSASGQILFELEHYGSSSSFYTFTYPAPTVTQKVEQHWTNNGWQNYSRETFTFTAGNPTNHLTETWDPVSNTWVNYGIFAQTYNSNNQVLSEISTLWNAGTNSWDNSERSVYHYDGLNNMLTDTNTTWNSQQNVWINQAADQYFYNCAGVYQGLTDLKQDDSGIEVYPNPASSYISISSKNSFSKVEILDVSGRIILTAEASDRISVNDLNEGVYFVRISDTQGKLLKTTKLLKSGF